VIEFPMNANLKPCL